MPPKPDLRSAPIKSAAVSAEVRKDGSGQRNMRSELAVNNPTMWVASHHGQKERITNACRPTNHAAVPNSRKHAVSISGRTGRNVRPNSAK